MVGVGVVFFWLCAVTSHARIYYFIIWESDVCDLNIYFLKVFFVNGEDGVVIRRSWGGDHSVELFESREGGREEGYDINAWVWEKERERERERERRGYGGGEWSSYKTKERIFDSVVLKFHSSFNCAKTCIQTMSCFFMFAYLVNGFLHAVRIPGHKKNSLICY